MPSKGQIVNQLMDGVLVMANANIELNLRCREALKPELRTSYRYLCAPSNPITTELIGDLSAPRYFKKLLKPVYSTLRSQGYLNVGYIDDSYLQGDSKTECRSNILTSLNLFESLGFLINHEKPVAFLGFVLHSVNRIVFLTAEIKRENNFGMPTTFEEKYNFHKGSCPSHLTPGL